MSTETTAEARKLTINDPLTQETLKKLAQLTNQRLQIADQLLDLEQEKIKLMVASRQIDDEKQRLFAKELTDRGLPPNAPVEVDAKTGAISIVTAEKLAGDSQVAAQVS